MEIFCLLIVLSIFYSQLHMNACYAYTNSVYNLLNVTTLRPVNWNFSFNLFVDWILWAWNFRESVHDDKKYSI